MNITQEISKARNLATSSIRNQLLTKYTLQDSEKTISIMPRIPAQMGLNIKEEEMNNIKGLRCIRQSKKETQVRP